MKNLRQKSEQRIEAIKELYANEGKSSFTGKSSTASKTSRYRKSFDRLSNNFVVKPLTTPSKSFNVFENLKIMQGQEVVRAQNNSRNGRMKPIPKFDKFLKTQQSVHKRSRKKENIPVQKMAT